LLAYMTFPAPHRAKLHSTNPLERVNGKIKRGTEVIGIFSQRGSPVWSAQSCSNRTMNRRSSAAAT
jgi:transposase-like protein